MLRHTITSNQTAVKNHDQWLERYTHYFSLHIQSLSPWVTKKQDHRVCESSVMFLSPLSRTGQYWASFPARRRVSWTCHLSLPTSPRQTRAERRRSLDSLDLSKGKRFSFVVILFGFCCFADGGGDRLSSCGRSGRRGLGFLWLSLDCAAALLF